MVGLNPYMLGVCVAEHVSAKPATANFQLTPQAKSKQ
jgi:hypothetical protein